MKRTLLPVLALLMLGSVFLLQRQREPPPDVSSAEIEELPVGRLLPEAVIPGAAPDNDPGVVVDEEAPDPTARQSIRMIIFMEFPQLAQYHPIDEDILELLSDGRITEAAAELAERAADGDMDANFLLAQLARSCEFARYFPEMSEDDLAKSVERIQQDIADPRRKAAAAPVARSLFHSQMNLRMQCPRIDFDRPAIEAGLTAAVAELHPPSLWALGIKGMWGDSLMSSRREPTADELLLLHTAAELGYWPALSLLVSAPEELKAEPRRLLERYSETSPWVAEQLAECYLNGCQGVARDAERAVQLYRRAAEHGIQGSVDGLARAAEELGDPDAAIESYAWSLFRERLDAEGCFGPTDLLGMLNSEAPARVRGVELSPYGQAAGEERAADYWQQYASQARNTLGCD